MEQGPIEHHRTPGPQQSPWFSSLAPDERPLIEPFWQIDSVADGLVVTKVLRTRFPREFEILTWALEQADPFQIVYPGNPNEYIDVVLEILVLLAAVDGHLADIAAEQIDQVVRQGLARRFGEYPPEERVSQVVTLVEERRRTEP